MSQKISPSLALPPTSLLATVTPGYAMEDVNMLKFIVIRTRLRYDYSGMFNISQIDLPATCQLASNRCLLTNRLCGTSVNHWHTPHFNLQAALLPPSILLSIFPPTLPTIPI